MNDLAYVVIMLACLASTFGLIELCSRLMPPRPPVHKERKP